MIVVPHNGLFMSVAVYGLFPGERAAGGEQRQATPYRPGLQAGTNGNRQGQREAGRCLGSVSSPIHAEVAKKLSLHLGLHLWNEINTPYA